MCILRAVFLGFLGLGITCRVQAAEEKKPHQQEQAYLDTDYGRIFVAGLPGTLFKEGAKALVTGVGKALGDQGLDKAMDYYGEVKAAVEGIGKPKRAGSKFPSCKLMKFTVNARGGAEGMVACQKAGHNLVNIAKVEGEWAADTYVRGSDDGVHLRHVKTNHLGIAPTDEQVRNRWLVRDNENENWMCLLTDAYGGGSNGRRVQAGDGSEEFDKNVVQLWANQRNTTNSSGHQASGKLDVWFYCRPM
jgi:hypothetical protein